MRLVPAVCVAAALWVSGCSGGGGDGSGSGAGAGGSAGTAGTGGDGGKRGGFGGSGNQGGSGGATGGSAGGEQIGILEATRGVVHCPGCEDTEFTAYRAAFADTHAHVDLQVSYVPYLNAALAATITEEQGCRVVEGAVAGGERPAVYPTAGTVRIDSESLNPEGVEQLYTGLEVLGAPQFEAGSRLTFSASGGDVPAFADSVRLPPAFQVTSPALSDTLSIPLTEDLTTTWINGGSGTTYVSLYGLAAETYTILSCPFEATAGTGTVPASLLSKLTGSLYAWLTIAEHKTQLISAGNFSIVLLARIAPVRDVEVTLE